MSRKILFLLIVLLSGSNLVFSQVSEDWVMNPKFSKKIESYLDGSVEMMSVKELNENLDKYSVFDAREKEEFEVSHIPSATYLGYKNPQFEILEKLDKDEPIVLYCSIGYRSEKLGQKLKEKGFTRVYNLYGSIFEWANRGYPLVNVNSENVVEVHAYSKSWSKWIDNTDIKKIY